jgi:tetratricopeptide (TPR) repeat protein
MTFTKKLRGMGSVLRDSAESVTRRIAGGTPAASHKEASVLLEKGRKFYNDKNFAKAEECFSRAVTEDPQYALAHYYLGLARYKRDNQRGAEAAWTQAMHVEPNSQAADKAEKKLNYAKRKLRDAVNELRRDR